MKMESCESVWEVGGECNAISASPNKEFVVVAGRDVLKINQINCEKRIFTGNVKNIRTGNPSRLNLTYSSNDVRWNKHYQYRHLMCTAATNGKIVIWNIEKAGIAKQERIYDEHGRTVNRVCWHPSDPMIVLSASQDSSIKLWDIREASSKLTMQSKAGPSRDVMWMPTSNSFKFAAAFETGVVQIWDIRDPKNYEIQLTGNQRDPILTIAWHPTQENIIASGSRDKLIKVWNVQENSRVPFAEIQTMQSLARVKWRPNHPTQLASCSMLFDNRIHIWDYKNPYIPVASFIGHTDVVTGFVWGSGSGEEIISCGKDSTVRFFGFNSDAYLPQKYLQLASVSWRAKNDLCFINDSKSIGVETEGLLNLIKPPISSSFEPALCSSYKLKIEPDSEELNSIFKVCKFNANCAKVQNLEDTSRIWEMLASFFEYDDFFPKPTSEIPSSSKEGHSAVDSNRKKSLERSFEEAHIEDNDLPFDPYDLQLAIPAPEEQQFSKENFRISLSEDQMRKSDFQELDRSRTRTSIGNNSQSRIHFKDSSKQLSSFQEDLKLKLSEIREFAVNEIIERAISQGDLQTCVTVFLVLKSGGVSFISASLGRQYLNSYLEILHRSQLWNHATEILDASFDPSDRSINQKSTSISIMSRCSCGRAVEISSGSGCSAARWVTCDKCSIGKQAIRCSICRLPVGGVYLMCQTCGHGGHMEHMYKWFLSNSHCPQGCLHQCKF